MPKLSRVFFFLSILLAVLTIFVIVKERNSQWRSYQEAYKQDLRKNAVSQEEQNSAARFEVGIRQDWIPELGRTDRCRSCHIAVDQARSSLQEPVTVHPDVSPHEFRKYGCTVCHGGEGYATRLPDAHKTLVPQKIIEAACGKCHTPKFNKQRAPTLAAGLELIEKNNCRGCHLLQQEQKNLYPGPNLSGISAKVNKEWLKKWLKAPKSYWHQAKMPDFLLTDKEITDLTGYLSSFPLPEKITAAIQAETILAYRELQGFSDADYDELAKQGKILFGRMRCLSCHAFEGKGGDLGPDFARISSKTNRQWVSMWLRDPKIYNPETIMPTFTMTPKERLSVVQYLFGESILDEEDDLADGNEPDEAIGMTAIADSAADAGAKLFTAKGCYNCHRLGEISGSANFAPELYALADKQLEKIEFGAVPIPHTLEDYITTKLQAPRIFADNLKMPFFGFDPKDVGRIATALSSFSYTIPASYTKKEAPPAQDIAGQMGQIVQKYNCLSCHQLNGRGGSLAPELSMEGSQVQGQWLQDYLQKPYAIRPFLEQRMPRFNLSDAEIQVISSFAALVWRDDRIDNLAVLNNGDPMKGEELYALKGCQTCHAIGTQGGYYGPALDNVGRRLQPAWIMARLDTVHDFVDDAKEPALAIPAEERPDLLAYLITLVGEKQQ